MIIGHLGLGLDSSKQVGPGKGSHKELKLIYLARAMRGHRNQGVSTQLEISDFWEVKSFGLRKCPRHFLELLLLLKR